MTENAPPAAATVATTGATTATVTATTTADPSSRGMPYYEKLRKDLRESITKKRTLDAQLNRLEEDIYRLENAYLEDTLHSGNIIKGFDGYMKAGASSSTTGGGLGSSTAGTGGGGSGTATRRKGGLTEADRIFSKSSAAIGRDNPVPPTQQTAQSQGQQSNNGSTPGLGTPGSSHAATPTASAAATPGATGAAAAGGAVKNKKSKKAAAAAANEDEGSEQQRKRTKISYGRD